MILFIASYRASRWRNRIWLIPFCWESGGRGILCRNDSRLLCIIPFLFSRIRGGRWDRRRLSSWICCRYCGRLWEWGLHLWRIRSRGSSRSSIHLQNSKLLQRCYKEAADIILERLPLKLKSQHTNLHIKIQINILAIKSHPSRDSWAPTSYWHAHPLRYKL